MCLLDLLNINDSINIQVLTLIFYLLKFSNGFLKYKKKKNDIANSVLYIGQAIYTGSTISASVVNLSMFCCY